ncbi:MAG TPA: DUF1801 domain-containing protein [Gemmatimonadales bacterium]|nr:DUF1801 domain-containing protein [Gemmatimonadales bacterium]
MPKTPKSNSTRKPPVPAESHAVTREWIDSMMPRIAPVLDLLDREIRAAIPDVQYAVKWQKAYYGTAELGWVIELAAYHISANIVFHGGADFDPPPPLGSTDRSRYIKLMSLEEAGSEQVRDWIRQAAQVPGWRY